jgi:hypothetical protein
MLVPEIESWDEWTDTQGSQNTSKFHKTVHKYLLTYYNTRNKKEDCIRVDMNSVNDSA